MLTVEEFKAANPGAVAIEDDGLQMLIDAAESVLVRLFGPSDSPVVETHDGGSSYIFLRRPADGPFDTVSERVDTTDTGLDEDDYRIRDDRVSVLRLGSGPNPRLRWGLTTVTYSPLDDEAERQRIIRALVMLDLNYAPGTSSEQIGSWMEQKQGSSVWNYERERDAILASFGVALAPGFA